MRRAGPPSLLQVEALSSFIQPDILEIWRAAIGPTLLPLHDRAVRSFGLFSDANLIVVAPSSSERALLGEFAAIRGHCMGTRAVYLVADQELARARARHFQQRYQRVGISTVVSSRHDRGFDGRIREGAFDIAVVVFDKLQGLLAGQPNLLRQVGVVVVDGLEILTDVQRGPALEVLLTTLRTDERKPRIVGLSAPIGQAHLISEWLSARLLVEELRPQELRKGVLVSDEFRYRECNSGRVGSEPFLSRSSDRQEHLMPDAVVDAVDRGERVIVFVRDCLAATNLVGKLIRTIALPPAPEIVAQLKELDDTRMGDLLCEAHGHGIAVHTPDMTREQREIIEQGFRAGQARLLVATNLITLPPDLVADVVILDSQRWMINGPHDNPHLEELSRCQYENLTSHAAVPALKTGFGRSILIAHSQPQASCLLERFSGRELEDVTPSQIPPLEDLVIPLLATRRARSEQELRELLLSTYTGRVYWADTPPSRRTEKTVADALKACTEAGLVRDGGNAGDLRVSRLGRIAAARSMRVATVKFLASWARKPRAHPPSELELLALVGQSEDGARVFICTRPDEDHRRGYKVELLVRLNSLAVRPGHAIFGPYMEEGAALEDDEVRAVKKTLALSDWIDESPTRVVEDRYDVKAGSLERIGQDYAWLLDGLAELCAACGWPPAETRRIEGLARRLRFGVKEDAVELMNLQVQGISRAVVPSLRAAGILELEALARSPEEAIRSAFGRGNTIAEGLFRHLHQQPEPMPPSRRRPAAADVVPDDKQRGHHPQPMASRAADQSLVPVARPRSAASSVAAPMPDVEERSRTVDAVELLIDVSTRRVTLWGRQIPSRPPGNLTPLLFATLTALALKAGSVVSESDLAATMERLGYRSRKTLVLDLPVLRYRLVQVLRNAAEPRASSKKLEALVETIPNVGLRLNAIAKVAGYAGPDA
jgi:helicase